MIINFVLPPGNRKKLSGGVLGLFNYANRLAELGHEVNVIPMLPSPEPAWIGGKFRIIARGLNARAADVALACAHILRRSPDILRRRMSEPEIKRMLHDAVGRSILLLDRRALPVEMRRAASLIYLRDLIPDADATVATSFETAMPTLLYGTGRKFYFVQHYEPYFSEEFSNPEVARTDAVMSYKLGLRMIANSSWARKKLEKEVHGARVELCLNAIDHDVFSIDREEVRRRSSPNEVVVISYGGRDAVWKGFCEMAEAVRIARRELPGVDIRWRVYGSALLPPDNEIAPYEPLGYLRQADLAKAYRESDMLLSASWYESFPAFPLEAMACGLPVITTGYGTEDYAIRGETAELVEPRNPDSIAAALMRLISNKNYRAYLARNGNAISKTFTWSRSAKTMERILSSDWTPPFPAKPLRGMPATDGSEVDTDRISRQIPV